MDKIVEKYGKLYGKMLEEYRFSDVEEKKRSYEERLSSMYASDIFRKHDVYPSMNVKHVYAVIAMCLELKGFGLSYQEIIDRVNAAFKKRKKFFTVLLKGIDLLPNAYKIAEKWNISDHDKRVQDGSITYDVFKVSDGKIEYDISHCVYVDMFAYYGIRPLCKIFCLTDVTSYATLERHVKFIRHSDLSDGNSCHDEVIRRK